MFLIKLSKLNKQLSKRVSSANSQRGFSLVEILIGSSIICLSLLLIVNLESGVSKIGLGSISRVQSNMLAEEGITAVKQIRNYSWQNINVLNNEVPYRLYWNQINNIWEATTSAVLIDNKFDRTITFSAVNRDSGSFEIIPSGGNVDYDTKKIVVEVSWQESDGTSTRALTSYVYNIFNK